jgi:peptide/nickel transport system substrate-binding protein
VSGRTLSLLCLLALGPGPASGAARARLGGTLSLGLVGLAPPLADVVEDSPEGASARALLALPLCRLLPGPLAVLASVTRPAAGPLDEVLVTALPGARFPDGTALSAREVADSLGRLGEAQSPYLPLLAPVAGLQEALESGRRHPEAPLRLRLLYPWPDFEASLCHPAFTPMRAGAAGEQGSGIGLYARGPEGRLLAARGAPGGLPFPGALAFSALPARAALRLLQRREVHAVLGEAARGSDASPLLFATYLVYRPGSLPAGVLQALAHVDFPSLVRTFVPGPAVAMRGLLPPGLAEVAPSPAPENTRPSSSATARAFSLGYETALPEHRAVAERLQVVLHDAGYRVRLLGDTHAGLKRARASGELEAALVSVLLPPLPAPALSLVLGLTGDKALLERELPPLGALADAAARAARVRERAAELGPTLPLVPLFARGLRLQLSEGLLDAQRDGFGLLVLDDAWLAR